MEQDSWGGDGVPIPEIFKMCVDVALRDVILQWDMVGQFVLNDLEDIFQPLQFYVSVILLRCP